MDRSSPPDRQTVSAGRLELTWVGKHLRSRPEPRILLADDAQSYPPGNREPNLLVHGDNLLALKALEPRFAGAVKCCFIDPPYNTGSAFAQYDDGLEHSIWLGLMRDRLELIRTLLTDDGSLWITVDDMESHYLKVVCDEVFGRRNFVMNVVWEKKFSPQNDSRTISQNHDHILVYARDARKWRPNLLPRSEKQAANFKNPDGDPRGPWISSDYTCAKSSSERPNLYYPIVNPNTGEEVWPRTLRVWAFDRASHERNVAQGLVWWGSNGRNPVPRLKKFAEGLRAGTVPTSVWRNEDVGNNQEAKREVIAFNASDPFATPKPERLIRRVLEIATGPGDLVLDSFAGSGTTGAVAHKMGRRWIMVELGDHCHTHIVPRLRRVVDGTDAGGVTRDCAWQGGGGFCYFTLAPSLVERDAYGRNIVRTSLDDAMLAEIYCARKGFTYAPHPQRFWQQGHSGERDFIYVTRDSLGLERLAELSRLVGEKNTLLVVCSAFEDGGRFANLMLCKLPDADDDAEYGRDDYRLNYTEPSDARVRMASSDAPAG